MCPGRTFGCPSNHPFVSLYLYLVEGFIMRVGIAEKVFEVRDKRSMSYVWTVNAIMAEGYISTVGGEVDM